MRYRSRYEARIASANPGFEYEALKISYSMTHKYTPDWRLPNGVLVESKGLWSSTERTALLLLRAAGHDIRMLFMNAGNRLSKASRTTYAEWCDKHAVPWAEGIQVPQEWLQS